MANTTKLPKDPERTAVLVAVEIFSRNSRFAFSNATEFFVLASPPANRSHIYTIWVEMKNKHEKESLDVSCSCKKSLQGEWIKIGENQVFFDSANKMLCFP